MTQEQLDTAYELIKGSCDHDDIYELYAEALDEMGGAHFHKDQEIEDVLSWLKEKGYDMLEDPMFGQDGWVILPKEATIK